MNQKTETSRVMTSNIETPKNLCNFLSDLNLSVNYDKVCNIKSNLAKSVIKRTKENGGVYKPSSILEGNPVFLAIDNSDLQIDTPGGEASYMPLPQQFINNMTLASLIYLP